MLIISGLEMERFHLDLKVELICQIRIIQEFCLTNSGDPVFTVNDKPYVLPNVGAGVYYFSEKIFAGISVPSFLSYRKTSTNSVQAYHSFNEYDFIFSGGGLIKFSQFFKFKPPFLINYSLTRHKKTYSV